jgi:hypothetical protein
MAATVRMMSVIREEIPAVFGELASTAKVSTEQVGRLGEMEVSTVSSTTTTTAMNPIAVRQMASSAIKEGGKCSTPYLNPCGEETNLVESSILSTLRQNTTPTQNQTTSLLEHLPNPTQLPSINTSMVSQTLEMEGVCLKETISNATQTGAGEVLEQIQLGDLGKVIAG